MHSERGRSDRDRNTRLCRRIKEVNVEELESRGKAIVCLKKQVETLKKDTVSLKDMCQEKGKTKENGQIRKEDILKWMSETMDEKLGEFTTDLLVSVGNMVNARLEGIKSRLPPEKILRPPLISDKRNERDHL
ncbi:unnamed protein product [Diatraea saccharalis]|uniref:Uncharacterized protein n=1 Tax=Diatraea saccharalis TaxID=40085 RepID=A0A9N9WI68_9NEOP|nr:unnamed protein product [Diatraea saccharalis]